ncbi:MAG: hypothetical protein GXO66_09650 [Euryarchaeota archaeon]|nr:hypothetical protein [Euryarchaeota archaeon]
MYCPECGVEVREDQNYCHVCGTCIRERLRALPPRQGERRNLSAYLIAGGVVLILALAVVLAPTPRAPQETAEVEGEFQEALDYTQAYQKLQLALSSGSPEEARQAFELFAAAYAELRGRAGEEHIDIIVPPDRLQELNLSLREGNLSAAERALSKIGSTCGIELCHAKGGSVMYDFASEYYHIVRAIKRNSTEEALARLPAFRSHFHRMKEVMAEIMPEKTEQTMKEEYIDRLEEALRRGDLNASREAMHEINSRMCSVDGCHSIIVTARLEEHEEVER